MMKKASETRENSPVLSVIVPVFNEQAALQKFLPELKKKLDSLPDSYELIAVDDGSADSSAEILKKLWYVKLVRHEENLGYGNALKTGIRNSRGTWIMIIDSDGTYSPQDAVKVWTARENSDMAIGARIGKDVQVPLMRKPAKLFLKYLSEYLVGKKIPDLNSGLRIFRKDLCEKYWSLYPQKFSFTTTITIAFMGNGYIVKFIPINYEKRIGTSTISPLRDFPGFTKLVIKLMLYFRPLKIFAPLSFGFLALSAAILAHNFYFYSRIVHDMTILFTFFLGINTLMLGLIAELASKR